MTTYTNIRFGIYVTTTFKLGFGLNPFHKVTGKIYRHLPYHLRKQGIVKNPTVKRKSHVQSFYETLILVFVKKGTTNNSICMK